MSTNRSHDDDDTDDAYESDRRNPNFLGYTGGADQTSHGASRRGGNVTHIKNSYGVLHLGTGDQYVTYRNGRSSAHNSAHNTTDDDD